MQPDGKLIAIKKEAKHAEFAREHFNSAGLDDEIDVRVGDAHRILIDLRDEVPSDFVFINSDRPGSPAYFDWAIDYLQVRGVIAVNNPFWQDTVDDGMKDEHSDLMYMFNQQVPDKSLFTTTIFPAGNGTLISVKNT